MHKVNVFNQEFWKTDDKILLIRKSFEERIKLECHVTFDEKKKAFNLFILGLCWH